MCDTSDVSMITCHMLSRGGGGGDGGGSEFWSCFFFSLFPFFSLSTVLETGACLVSSVLSLHLFSLPQIKASLSPFLDFFRGVPFCAVSSG